MRATLVLLAVGRGSGKSTASSCLSWWHWQYDAVVGSDEAT